MLVRISQQNDRRRWKFASSKLFLVDRSGSRLMEAVETVAIPLHWKGQ